MMIDITEIMDMLDWHMPFEIQSNGISLARNTEIIIPFIQPVTPKHNKNVWANCAVIIAEKSDENLKPYLVELLEWLQDMNWPGAFCILNRLQKYSDNNSICNASIYTSNNLDRMRKGLAPIIDGDPMELHHPFGRSGKNFFIFEPLTKNEHFFTHYGRSL